MSWFNIIKMPKPYRGPDIRNEAQYKAASLEGRMLWHRKQAKGYDTRLRAIRTQHTVDLTDVENPIYKEMVEYQNMRNFHGRQKRRLRKCLALGKTECNDYYSLELEGDNFRRQKLKTTPTGKSDPYVELSLEAYNNLTDKQKINYHAGMQTNGKDIQFHHRMRKRIGNKSKEPVFPSPKYGGESTRGLENTKEEYDNMDKTDRRRFHIRMEKRAEKNNELQLRRFHGRMRTRLQRNIPLPTYFSPEHEQEEQ